MPDSFKAFTKAFDPEWAIVPKLAINSSLFIPIPKSGIEIKCFFSLVLTVISNFKSGSKIFFSINLVCLNFSVASEALEINSLMKISLSVYKELTTISNTCFTSAWNSNFFESFLS